MTTSQIINQIICRTRTAASLTTSELFAVDLELTDRAVLLGKRGQVSKPHAAVRRELAAR